MRVELNDDEWELAKQVGKARQGRRSAAGDRSYWKTTEAEAEAAHIVGAAGEIAAAKVLNRYPSGLFLDMAADDDVSGIQVRTRRKEGYELYLFPKDPEDAWYVLLIGTSRSFVYKGAIHGKDAMKPENWREKGKNGSFPKKACWIVSPYDLDAIVRP